MRLYDIRRVVFGGAVLVACNAIESQCGDTPATPLLCQRVATAPMLNGNLDDAVWKDAAPLSIDSMTVRGVVQDHTLYLAIECTEPSLPKAAKRSIPGDDPTVQQSFHVDLAVSDGRNTVYRVLLAPDGRNSDMRQDTSPDKTWTNDPQWSSRVSIIQQVQAKRWTAELAIPVTSGSLCLQRQTPGQKNLAVAWHPLTIVERSTSPSTTLSEGAGVIADLATLTEEQLIALAKKQANEPQTVEDAKRQLEAGVKILDLMMNERIPAQELAARMKEEMKPLTGKGPSIPLPSDDELQEQVEQMAPMRGAMKMMQPMINKQIGFERALIDSGSLPGFLHTMKEQFGEKALKGLPQPDGEGNIPFRMDSNKAIGPAPKDLPKRWEDLTEDQFQSVRQHKLTGFTPAGQEYTARKKKNMQETMGGASSDETETTP